MVDFDGFPVGFAIVVVLRHILKLNQVCHGIRFTAAWTGHYRGFRCLFEPPCQEK